MFLFICSLTDIIINTFPQKSDRPADAVSLRQYKSDTRHSCWSRISEKYGFQKGIIQNNWESASAVSDRPVFFILGEFMEIMRCFHIYLTHQ